MSRPAGQLERSLAALTISVAHGSRQRQKALDDSRTSEYEQQIRIPLSGQAGVEWVSTEKQFTWEQPFLYAPLQRKVPFSTPQFTSGIEFSSKNGLVVVHAHLVAWTITEENWVIGATIEFAAGAPNAAPDTVVSWSAIAHLSFEGYSTYAEGT